MFIDSKAVITIKKKWGNWVLFSLDSPKIASHALPGQFIMVKINDFFYPLLRRPFSIHNVIKKNRKPQEIEIFFQIVGEGTELLSKREKGEKLNIIGPLGKGFSLDFNLKNKKFYLVGGGRGIAPLYYLAMKIKEAEGKAIVFYGGKSKKDLPILEKFKKEKFLVKVSTEDGSHGMKGLITELLNKELKKGEKIEKIYSCGPEGMMKKVSEMAEAKKIPAEFSMESIFGCGIGACFGCVVKIRRNGKEYFVKACTEGPVFKRGEIVW